MHNQRVFLYVALAMIVFMIWDAWERQHAPLPAPPSLSTPADPATKTDAAPQAGAGAVPTVPEAPRANQSVANPTGVAAPAPNALIRGERIEVVTDLYRAIIDVQGGDLRELYLRKHAADSAKPDVPFRLLSDDEVFIVQTGLIGHEGEFPTHRTLYKAAQPRYALEEKDNVLRVPLSFSARDGVRYTKTYIFRRDSYVIDVEFSVTNTAKREWSGYLYGQFQRTPVEPPGIFAVATYTGPALFTPENQYEKVSFDDLAKAPLKRNVTGGWLSMLQHYFVGAWMPMKAERTQYYSDSINNGERYVIGYKQLDPTTVAAGQTGTLATRLYAGPKEHRRLVLLACPDADLAQKPCDEKDQTRAPGMDLTADYGSLTFIAAPLFRLLKWLHDMLGNWGWAIVALTVLVKLMFYPLSAMSYKSMAKMRNVQPKMESIRKQYGHDRAQMNQAMMELYKTEKLNPFGGCLPILIQIPVFIALYWVLLESVEMRQAPWILWIKDLSAKDPYFVLPVLMGGSMYLQQALSPQPPDPVQRKVFMFMPLIFTGMFVFFPAGLVLYWTVNNLLSIAQQWRVNQVMAAKKKAK